MINSEINIYWFKNKRTKLIIEQVREYFKNMRYSLTCTCVNFWNKDYIMFCKFIIRLSGEVVPEQPEQTTRGFVCELE